MFVQIDSDCIDIYTLFHVSQCANDPWWASSVSFEYDDGPESSPFLITYVVNNLRRDLTAEKAVQAVKLLYEEWNDVYRRLVSATMEQEDCDMFLQLCLFGDIWFDDKPTGGSNA